MLRYMLTNCHVHALCDEVMTNVALQEAHEPPPAPGTRKQVAPGVVKEYLGNGELLACNIPGKILVPLQIIPVKPWLAKVG